jgi:hypothetical protein
VLKRLQIQGYPAGTVIAFGEDGNVNYAILKEAVRCSQLRGYHKASYEVEILVAAKDELLLQHGLPSSAVVTTGKVTRIGGEAILPKVMCQPCASLAGLPLDGVLDISEEEYLRVLVKLRPELEDTDDGFLNSDELEDYNPEFRLDPEKYLDTFDSQTY